ncbi:MAG: 2-oxo acid dehydrogenase subunit E2 [Bacteroidales bacterium]|nr:2-oxo acid dehydrogenase subunit E2 [Bacteroidales bacterium]
MGKFELVMPKMGESIIEATITKWLKTEGDTIEEDDAIVEISTDKVDSEIPSPVEGTMGKQLYSEGDTISVGEVIAYINTEEEEGEEEAEAAEQPAKEEAKAEEAQLAATDEAKAEPKKAGEPVSEGSKPIDTSSSGRFYSPLVRSIAREENITVEELDQIKGTGQNGRVTKRDVLQYLEDRKAGKAKKPAAEAPAREEAPKAAAASAGGETASYQMPGIKPPEVRPGPNDEVVDMDRMRKMIAEHMVTSKHVSPHVTSFIDVDMTNIVNWRNKVKDEFQKREGEKLTFTPIFIEATAKALKKYPWVNASVMGQQVVLRKDVNVGMATALPNSNLIVPVIKKADQKNLLGLAKDVNDLANRARNNKLQPDEIQDGTFTVTNFGSFSSTTGNPIINQPQVAILAVGVIKKKPVVLEQPEGDVIAIRHMMTMSLSYDHRVVDGALGGKFLKDLADYLENFDTTRTV